MTPAQKPILKLIKHFSDFLKEPYLVIHGINPFDPVDDPEDFEEYNKDFEEHKKKIQKEKEKEKEEVQKTLLKIPPVAAWLQERKDAELPAGHGRKSRPEDEDDDGGFWSSATARLDRIATELEQAGAPLIALAIDKVSDSLEDKHNRNFSRYEKLISDFYDKKDLIREKSKDAISKVFKKYNLVPKKFTVEDVEDRYEHYFPSTEETGTCEALQISADFYWSEQTQKKLEEIKNLLEKHNVFCILDVDHLIIFIQDMQDAKKIQLLL